MIRLRQQMGWFKRVQLALAGLALVGAAAFYLLLYRPAVAQRAEMTQQMEQSRLRIDSNMRQTDNLSELAGEVRRLKDAIGQSRALPPDQELWQFVRNINQFGQKANLQKLKCEPAQQRLLPLYDELPISLRFEGNFVNVFGFLQQIEQLPRQIRATKLSLRSLDGKAGVVDVQLTLNIYSLGDR